MRRCSLDGLRTGNTIIIFFNIQPAKVLAIVTYCIISCSGYKAGKRQRNIVRGIRKFFIAANTFLSQFRQVFQLRNSNYLIPVMAKQKVLEVSRKGKIIAEHQIEGKAFSSLELPDGNLLLPCGDNHYYIVIDRKTGKELKRVNALDIEGIALLFVGQILQLKNGNLLICNWYGHTKDTTVDEPQLIEIDKNGKVVWSLHDKKNVGKISAACYIDNFRLPDLK